ncbi:MAG: PaaI family thioesterase [Myxococcota bacterium]|nr:PaaI family thioesterase [Myxococcota bacterium]
MDPATLTQLVASLPPEKLAALLTQTIGGLDAHLGLAFVWASPDKVIARLTPGPQHTQPYGLVHGGVYCSATEATCSVGAALAVLPTGRNAVGVENHTRFLHAARPGTTLTSTATPAQVDGPRHTWSAVVTDADGTCCARAEVVVRALDPQAHVGGAAVRLERHLGED